MENTVPGTSTIVQDQNQQMEPKAPAQVPNNPSVEAPASAPLSNAAATNASSSPIMTQNGNQNLILGQGYKEWINSFTAGELGKVSNSIKTGIEELVIPFFGQNAIIQNISASDVERLLDHIIYDSSSATPATVVSKAKAAYDSGMCLFDFFVTKNFIKENPFRNVAPELIPGDTKCVYDTNDDFSEEAAFTDEDMKKFLDACLKSTPKYSAVKAVIFIYLMYAYAIPSSHVLQITWNDIDTLKANGQLDNFINRLLNNYRVAQKRWLKQKRIINPEGYLFVKKGDAGSEGIPCDSGFVTTWIKTHITNRRNMPYVTLGLLTSDEVPLGPLKGLDKNSNYPILGKVIIDGDYYRRGPSFDASNFSARWTDNVQTASASRHRRAGSGNRFVV